MRTTSRRRTVSDGHTFILGNEECQSSPGRPPSRRIEHVDPPPGGGAERGRAVALVLGVRGGRGGRRHRGRPCRAARPRGAPGHACRWPRTDRVVRDTWFAPTRPHAAVGGGPGRRPPASPGYETPRGCDRHGGPGESPRREGRRAAAAVGRRRSRPTVSLREDPVTRADVRCRPARPASTFGRAMRPPRGVTGPTAERVRDADPRKWRA
jgi:hypothetical protein